MGAGQCPSCGQMFPAAGGYCPNDGTRTVDTSPGDALVGRTLDDRYEIREPLAPPRAGAIGAMYRGYQPSVTRDVAIKIIHPQLAQDPDLVERFFQAGRAAAQLAGPALANVYDINRSADGIVYVVSELARGVPLSDHAGRAMPARRVVGLALQLADALGAIHRAQLAHGDLDLASLVVDEAATGDQLKLLDIGLAASLMPARAGYAAPEQLAGYPASPAADLYAVGAILYELLAGAPPFAGPDLAARHLHDPPPQLPPNIPIPLAAIVYRLLSKTPAERGTAADLRAKLREVEAHVGVAVPRTSSNPNLAIPRTASADLALPRTQTPMNLPRIASADFGPAIPRTRTPDLGYPVVSRAASNEMLPDVARLPSRRWLVIAIVAALASGIGITVILLAG